MKPTGPVREVKPWPFILKTLAVARSLVYSTEGLPLIWINRALTGRWKDPQFQPPKEYVQASELEGLRLLSLDAERAQTGLFPTSLLLPERPISHLRSLIDVWIDGLRVAWRMREKSHDEFSKTEREKLVDLPDYYRRNFHFQSGGYLSRASAARYDHQVEILFRGAANAMRRLALVPLVQHFKNKKCRLLELGAGAGSFTHQVEATLPKARITALDLSEAYLQMGRDLRNKRGHVDLVQGDASHTPFRDHQFDGAYTIFMFHELPTDERRAVINEAHRVLKDGGQLVVVDSLQWDDNPALNWGLQRFPKDFHEPFYADYIKKPLEVLLTENGFEITHRELGLVSKCLAAKKIPQVRKSKKS